MPLLLIHPLAVFSQVPKPVTNNHYDYPPKRISLVNTCFSD